MEDRQLTCRSFYPLQGVSDLSACTDLSHDYKPVLFGSLPESSLGPLMIWHIPWAPHVPALCYTLHVHPSHCTLLAGKAATAVASILQRRKPGPREVK